MKKTKFATTAGILGCAAFLAAAPVKAGDPVVPAPAPASTEIGAEVSVGYDTHYIFRGFNVGENLVWGGVDLGVPLGEGLSLNLGTWYGSLADSAYDELNLLAGVTKQIGNIEVGVGAIWYYFGQGINGGGSGIEDALELGASLGASLGPIDLHLGYYYDLEEDGSYIELAAEHTYEVSDRIAFVPGALISYADDYYGVSGFNAVGARLTMPIKLTDNATLSPYIAATWEIDGSGQDDEVYGGISLSVSF